MTSVIRSLDETSADYRDQWLIETYDIYTITVAADLPYTILGITTIFLMGSFISVIYKHRVKTHRFSGLVL